MENILKMNVALENELRCANLDEDEFFLFYLAFGLPNEEISRMWQFLQRIKAEEARNFADLELIRQVASKEKQRKN
jgi:hypothetical protein